MATLEERIQRLEDIRECEQLQYKYEYYLDHGYQGDGIASLFTEDGLWEIKGCGGTAKGHEAIKAHAIKLGAAIPWGQHSMMVPMVEINPDGKSATGTFRLICTITMTIDGKDDAYILVGNYTNKYVKIDGKWYFSELTGVIEQTAPWDKGWVKAAFTKESW
jgi:hypothetical protein